MKCTQKWLIDFFLKARRIGWEETSDNEKSSAFIPLKKFFFHSITVQLEGKDTDGFLMLSVYIYNIAECGNEITWREKGCDNNIMMMMDI